MRIVIEGKGAFPNSLIMQETYNVCVVLSILKISQKGHSGKIDFFRRIFIFFCHFSSSTAQGCCSVGYYENGQPIGVHVHWHCVEKFTDFSHRYVGEAMN